MSPSPQPEILALEKLRSTLDQGQPGLQSETLSIKTTVIIAVVIRKRKERRQKENVGGWEEEEEDGEEEGGGDCSSSKSTKHTKRCSSRTRAFPAFRLQKQAGPRI